MDNMIFTSEVCGVVLIAPFDKISRPPCSTIRFIVFLSLFFRCFSPFSFYHRTFSLTTQISLTITLFQSGSSNALTNLNVINFRLRFNHLHAVYDSAIHYKMYQKSQQPTSGASCIYKCNMIKFYRQIALNDRMKRTPRRQYELS